jgi:hypothetical protein
MRKATCLFAGLLLGGALAAPPVALADHKDDVRAHVRVGPAGHPHAVVRVDRFHRVPPGIRARGFPRRVTVRVNPFRGRLGWRVNRFTPGERAMWTHGRWWHGRRGGRLGWWWWAGGGWYFYPAPVYPYPDYVSETIYDEPSSDYGDYWYYCRNPRGYYPYVQTCRSAWQPVPAQPDAGYGGGYGNGDQYAPGNQMGPNDQGPPDGYGPQDDQGPPDGYGPDDQGSQDGYGPDDQGPPDGNGSDDQGPPDEGPPPQ